MTALLEPLHLDDALPQSLVGAGDEIVNFGSGERDLLLSDDQHKLSIAIFDHGESSLGGIVAQGLSL